MSKISESILTIGWSIKLGLKINPRIFIFWSIFSIALAVLPAIALHFNREAVSILSQFISSGEGVFGDVLPTLVVLGVILTAIGVSRRINGNFLYFIMYDAYYHGMQEYLMDVINSIEIKALMNKEYREDYYAAAHRCGSLADFMSSGTLFLSKFAGCISLLTVAFTVSGMIFVVATSYIIAVLLFNIVMANRLRWDDRPANEASRLANYYQNSVMSPGVAKELRVYNLGAETLEKWDKAYDKEEHYRKKRNSLQEIAAFISGTGFFLFMAGMLGYSVFSVANGNMTVDVFLMLYAMGQSISATVQILSSSLQETDRGLFILVMQRRFVKAIPKEAQDWREGFEPSDEKIVFQAENLSFSYDDEREVLSNLNFSIKKGETIALVGVNGSGKTTLVKLLIGLFSPTAGELKFCGKTYDPKSRGAVIKQVGMFFQNFYIFHASFRENVGFGDLKSLGNEGRILLAMEKGGAEKLPDRYPEGLNKWLNRDIKKDGAILSGGEKQRVAVSRAHMSDKDVLIFDEPAAALDPIAEMKQFHAIREKIEGRTAILISHRVGFARLADRILVLDNGRLAQNGTHDELIERGGIYANFYREQAQWYE